MLRGLEIVFLFLLVFKVGIPAYSSIAVDAGKADIDPVKTEYIQEQNSILFDDICDVDDDEVQSIYVLQLIKTSSPVTLVKGSPVFNCPRFISSSFIYLSDSSPPNWMN